MIFGKSLPCQGDDAVALFAAAQFGLISRAQARRAGLSPEDVAVRLRRGVWTRTRHWGVFRVLGYGTLASPLKRAVVAAQLALAPGAFACRDTAARLWQLEGLPEWDGHTVDMGLRWRPGPTGFRSVAPTVRVHSLRIAEDDVVRRAPIRMTGLSRTLRDMSTCSGPSTSMRLCGSAVGRGLLVSGATKALPRRKRAVCRKTRLPSVGDNHAPPDRPDRSTGPGGPTGPTGPDRRTGADRPGRGEAADS
ncbi:type IV toxin-antitoxin system AbiEi family antitoxin domain-containing protein [Streptomonospora litoralis]|uniref:AbiEi antitoxin C-terminal domain-containing protein n=1 Tax=Streptomonospora litoralis TaxID=2498135 RepID=A0A4P6Q155_9ACTN|nr:type IV toxin-antitoxin system AbiEi family antitoxin domain-containing protein [Streptomonospora litoralis]QBI52539.1 hypothetical protein EKD16_03645 [Streptomonospora litoralis]